MFFTMTGSFLLIVSLFGKILAQQTFDSMERPLFEDATSPFRSDSRPLLAIDQHPMDSNGLQAKAIHVNQQVPPSSLLIQLPPQSHPQPVPQPPSKSPPQSPPQSLPQPLPRPPLQVLPQQNSPSQILAAVSPNVPAMRQPPENEELPRISFHLQFPRQPLPSNPPVRTVLTPSSLGVLNQDRIHVEGFQPIERRFTSTKRKRSLVIVGDVSTSAEEKDDEFLPVEPSARRLSALDLFDQRESEVDNNMVSEGSGAAFQNASRSGYISSTNLRPESGYQASATRISNGAFTSLTSKNQLNSRLQQEEAEEESNSILDQEEGSGFGEVSHVSVNEDSVGETPLVRSSFASEVSEKDNGGVPFEVGSIRDSPTPNRTTVIITNVTFSTFNQSHTVEPKLPTRAAEGLFVPTSSSNSVPFVRDSKLLRIFKEYAVLIVVCLLGLPAIVVLCYFLNLKRVKRYSGTMDVTPRQTFCHPKKSESRKTICSEENELACSPPTSSSKTPQPPPFPTDKKYVH
ncbi:hypothetical protein GHT06_013171 [Daphnia sinensis]|uniref:Uncharacterized protein n=1 Tax=Daphnia sinensis TaxID=1820382 RepID=A0AAD5KX39_9CRUS|nr:hypothetical protein GHT06_013171 [Daphnia sinensis]